MHKGEARGPNIRIGEGTTIDDSAIVRGNVNIGNNNTIYPYVVVGTGPQHISHPESDGRIVINDNNIIREFTTVHAPTGTLTSMGSGCYIMSYCHIAHDCIIHDNVIMATRVTLGGHVTIFQRAYMGQGSEVHPFCRIGSYAMIAMGCPVVKDVPPFALINRGRFTKINRIGLERAGISGADIDGIHDTYSGGFERNSNDTWYEKEIESFLREAKSTYRPDF